MIPPLPPPPPPAGGHVPPPPPPMAQPQPTTGRSGCGRPALWVVIGVVVGVLVVVAGCTTLVYVGGSRLGALVGATRAPVDTANEFLDAVRVGGSEAGRHVCPGPFDLAEELRASSAQHLSSVHISNNRVATVSGTVTLAGGRTSPLTVELRRTDDGWCVSSTRFEAASD